MSKYGMSSGIWSHRRRKVIRRDNYTCQYCGIVDVDTITVDHVIPVSDGGSSHIANLVACCVLCNHMKGTKPAAVFLAEIGKIPSEFVKNVMTEADNQGLCRFGSQHLRRVKLMKILKDAGISIDGRETQSPP